jgi:2'-5' RNA ligase
VSAADDPQPNDPGATAAGERARLFVALELPEEVRAELARWRTRPLRGVSGLHAIAPEDLHATMCFLGWRPTEQIGAISNACSVLAAQSAPQLRLGEAIWLPPRRPRVLAVELQDPLGALARAQAALAEVLEAGGWYEPEERPYLGHVTTARVLRGTRIPPRPLTAPSPLAFSGHSAVLYRSRLSRAGARYEPLTTVELAG